jgi:hypothetical protein
VPVFGNLYTVSVPMNRSFGRAFERHYCLCFTPWASSDKRRGHPSDR